MGLVKEKMRTWGQWRFVDLMCLRRVACWGRWAKRQVLPVVFIVYGIGCGQKGSNHEVSDAKPAVQLPRFPSSQQLPENLDDLCRQQTSSGTFHCKIGLAQIDYLDPWDSRLYSGCSDHEVIIVSCGRDGKCMTDDDLIGSCLRPEVSEKKSVLDGAAPLENEATPSGLFELSRGGRPIE